MSENSEGPDAKRIPPPAAAGRLPGYHRCLRALLTRDVLRISSKELAKLTGTTASQIRQDLSYFGGFGQQGYGYNVRHLYTGLSSVLGVTDNFSATLFGAGDLARALAADPVFAKRGVLLRAVVAVPPERAEGTVLGLPVLPLEAADGQSDDRSAGQTSWQSDIAVLCSEGLTALYPKELARLLGGFRGIWNFTSLPLDPRDLPGSPIVRNISLGDSLMLLCYDIKRSQE